MPKGGASKSGRSPDAIRGVTRRRREELKMKLEKVFDDYPNSFFVVEPLIEDGESSDFEYIYVNEAFCLFLGRSREELVGHRFRDVFGDPGERVWLDAFRDAAVFGKYRQLRDMSVVIDKHLSTEIFHVAPNRCGCIIRDFDDVGKSRKEEADLHSSRELARKAYIDYLTGFYNRFYLQERSSELLGSRHVGLAFLDINNLKVTNDTLGHNAGDELIRDFSGKLREFYPDAQIYRMGGDEFLVITLGMTEDAFLEASEAAELFFSQGRMSTAMGYKFCETIADLWQEINCCDQMMYQHKRAMKMKKVSKE